MKQLQKTCSMIAAFATVVAGFAAFTAIPALAYSPTLTIYASGSNSSTVTMSVTGAQPNSTVSVYYYTSSNTSTAILGGTYGTTDYSGSFTAQEPFGSDSQTGITGRYALIAGTQTNTVYASTYAYGSTTGSNGAIGFSTTNPVLSIGQSTSVSIYANGGYSYSYGSYYISSNSNPNIVTANISGSTIQLYGLAYGSSSIVVCNSSSAYGNNYGYGSQCGTLYVNVGGTGGVGGNGAISFSQNSVSLSSGQTIADTIYGSNGYYGSGYAYYISSNTNSAAVTATISGSSIQLYGLASGTSTITVCAASNGYYGSGYAGGCGTIYVTVSGNGYASGSITFSQTSVPLNVGQSYSDTVYMSGGSLSYYGSSLYISQNTNSYVASATLSGSALQIYANTNGSTSITVCSNSSSYNYGSNCATVYVTVSGYGNGYGSTGTIIANPSNPYISYGQSEYISLSQTVYNGYSSGTFYISSNTNPSVVSATISGSTMSIYGSGYGTSIVTVCGSNTYTYASSANCLPITITVNQNGSGNGYSGAVTFSNANPVLTVGQTTTVNVYNSNAYGSSYSPFYLSSNQNASIASATFSGSTLQLVGLASGSTVMSVCASTSANGSQPTCGSLYVTVQGSSTGVNGGNPPSQVLGVSTYQNGQLIQEGQQIAIVYRDTQSPFSNYSAFTGLGFQSSNVLNVGYSNIPLSGHVISTQYAAHPWGTWVKSGNTVYFVSEYGLIPVPDYGTFTNNGGQDAWVVPANTYDLQLPMQSNMVYNDSRLSQ